MPGSTGVNGLLSQELVIPFGVMYNFALVMARVGGLFAFASLPALKSATGPAKAALVVLLTILVYPLAPVAQVDAPSPGAAVMVMLSELSLGLFFGLAIQLMQEGILLGAQILSVQAGFSYASTIDPASNADSPVIQVFLTLAFALIFLALGLDRLLIRTICQSLISLPVGTFAAKMEHAEPVIKLGSEVFATGLRMAGPVIALLLLVDVSMALLSRIQAQLQLLSLSFPIKILASLAMLAVTVKILPSIIEASAGRTFNVIEGVLRTGGR